MPRKRDVFLTLKYLDFPTVAEGTKNIFRKIGRLIAGNQSDDWRSRKLEFSRKQNEQRINQALRKYERSEMSSSSHNKRPPPVTLGRAPLADVAISKNEHRGKELSIDYEESEVDSIAQKIKGSSRTEGAGSSGKLSEDFRPPMDSDDQQSVKETDSLQRKRMGLDRRSRDLTPVGQRSTKTKPDSRVREFDVRARSPSPDRF